MLDWVKNAAKKYLVDYNPAATGGLGIYNAGADALSGNFNPGTQTNGVSVADTAVNAVKGMDPANPYQTLQAALGQAANDSKQLAATQWQRQMEGLGQALGFVKHSQGAFDKVYGQQPNAPGATLPQGLGAQIPQGGQPPQGGGAGLQAFFGRGR